MEIETTVKETEWKGHQVISINKKMEEGDYPTRIAFGVIKAKMILANIDAIKAFVKKNSEDEKEDEKEAKG